MTASSAAAVEATRMGAGLPALAAIVAGGLVEGSVLGVLQARVLASRWGSSIRPGWTWVTVTVAGLGWAGASAPSALTADSGGGTEPALWVVVGGAVALGAVMGAALGWPQATVLSRRTAVDGPWWWVAVSAAGWSAAMPIIFLGATIPDESWPATGILAMGPPTGLLAGLAFGLITRPVVGDGPLHLLSRPRPRRVATTHAGRSSVDESTAGHSVRP